MKNCKSCTKEIDDKASKCPYCQSFQYWYKNPQYFGMIFPLIFITIIFYSTGMFGSPKYLDYKDKISILLVSETIVDNQKIINYKIVNNTNVSWNNISYNAVGYGKDGSVVISSPGHEFQWSLPANGSTILSVKASKDEQIVKWDIQITELRKNRF